MGITIPTWTLSLSVLAFAVVYYSGHGKCVLKLVSRISYGKWGCLPVPDVGDITLHYFDTRGRAEPIRLLMEYSNITYKEINFNKDEWPAHKEKGIKDGFYTFGQVPAIETSTGMRLVQSNAILHYLARSVGLDCDCHDYHTCDIIAAGTDDLRTRYGKLVYDPQFSMKTKAEYISQTLPTWLQYFEKLAPSIKEEFSAFVGDRISWVDFLVFDILDTNVVFGGGLDVLADFPKLRTYYERFISLPHLSKYLSGRKPFQLPQQPLESRGKM